MVSTKYPICLTSGSSSTSTSTSNCYGKRFSIVTIMVLVIVCTKSVTGRVTLLFNDDDDDANNNNNNKNGNKQLPYQKRYISTQTAYRDRIGKSLWNGYQYFARVQYVPDNLELCPSSSNTSTTNNTTNNSDIKPFQLIPTVDGLPIALLVQKGSVCTIEQKVKFVLEQMNGKIPTNISTTTTTSKDTTTKDDNNNNNNNNQPIVRYLLIDDLPTLDRKASKRKNKKHQQQQQQPPSTLNQIQWFDDHDDEMQLAMDQQNNIQGSDIVVNDNSIGNSSLTLNSNKSSSRRRRHRMLSSWTRIVDDRSGLREKKKQFEQRLKFIDDPTDYYEDYYNNNEFENAPIYIIHISQPSYESLLDVVVNEQSDYTRTNGGIRITIDSLDGLTNDWTTDEVAFVSVAIVCMAATLGCIFWIFFSDTPTSRIPAHVRLAEHNRRQQQQQQQANGPRKLTLQQVERLLTIYVYDGTSLYTASSISEEDAEIGFASKQRALLSSARNSSSNSNLNNASLLDTVDEDEDDDVNVDDNNPSSTSSTTTANNNNNNGVDSIMVGKGKSCNGVLKPTLSSISTSSSKVLGPPIDLHDVECSICLDEYDAGMQVRVLPCGHAFHSCCVERWLTERSATCPLCKHEIHGGGDDDDEADEELDDDSTSEDDDDTEQSQARRSQGDTSIWNWIFPFSQGNNVSTSNNVPANDTERGDESELQVLSGDSISNNSPTILNNNDDNSNSIQPLESSITPSLDDDLLQQPLEQSQQQQQQRQQRSRSHQPRFVSASMWRRLVWNVTTVLNGLPSNNSDDSSIIGHNSMMMVETSTSSSSSPSVSVSDMLAEPLLSPQPQVHHQ